MFVHEVENPARPGFPVGPFLQEAYALNTADVKVKLVSEQRSQKSPYHNPRQFEISAVSGETSHDKHRFTFKESAHGYGNISIR